MLPSGPAIIGCPIIITQANNIIIALKILIFCLTLLKKNISNGKKDTIGNNKNFINFSI
jgi:hypothetical protein